MTKPTPQLLAALAKAIENGWDEENIEIETSGTYAWEAYKAIMNGLSYSEYKKIINTGGSIRFIPQDGKGF